MWVWKFRWSYNFNPSPVGVSPRRKVDTKQRNRNDAFITAKYSWLLKRNCIPPRAGLIKVNMSCCYFMGESMHWVCQECSEGAKAPGSSDAVSTLHEYSLQNPQSCLECLECKNKIRFEEDNNNDQTEWKPQGVPKNRVILVCLIKIMNEIIIRF